MKNDRIVFDMHHVHQSCIICTVEKKMRQIVFDDEKRSKTAYLIASFLLMTSLIMFSPAEKVCCFLCTIISNTNLHV